MTWRKRAWAVVYKVMCDNPDVSGDDLKKILRESYPFGMRKHWPYKVWLDVVREAFPCAKVKPLDELPLFRVEP